MKILLKHLFLTLTLLSLMLGMINVSQAQSARPDAEQIRAFLSTYPLIVQSNTTVLNVTIEGEALVIDLSREFLPNGTYDEELFYQLQADLTTALAVNQYYLPTFWVEGLPLEEWGRPLPDFVPLPIESNPDRDAQGPLAGYRIALNPGHGRYWDDINLAWQFQRGVYYGIREDLINADIVRLISWSLTNHGATVIDVREQDVNARTGASGLPAWQEAAREYAIYEGMPSWVWNGSDVNYNDDIRARPYIANYYSADLLISLHNNGYDGTKTGTETYYETKATYGDPVKSLALANAVHNSIINTIRSKYNSSWVDRKVKSSTAAYGEVYYARMPAILLELAFMDTESPDNDALRDPRFRVFAAEAIVDGICSYLNVNCGDIPISSPTVDEVPVFTPLPIGSVCESGWASFTNQRGQTAAVTPNAGAPNQATQFAVWNTLIPYDGMYHVEAFIPAYSTLTWTCPSLTLTHATHSALYQVTHAYGSSTVTVDQSTTSNHWVDLGVYYFKKGQNSTIKLNNLTLEANQSAWVGFSAVKLSMVAYGSSKAVYYFPLSFR